MLLWSKKVEKLSGSWPDPQAADKVNEYLHETDGGYFVLQVDY